MLICQATVFLLLLLRVFVVKLLLSVFVVILALIVTLVFISFLFFAIVDITTAFVIVEELSTLLNRISIIFVDGAVDFVVDGPIVFSLLLSKLPLSPFVVVNVC